MKSQGEEVQTDGHFSRWHWPRVVNIEREAAVP